MNDMKKLALITLFMMTLFLVGCGEKTTAIPDNAIAPYQMQTNTTEYGSKSYITNDQGTPLLFLSTEVRLDLLILADQITYDDLDAYFKVASDTGFNTMEVAFMWSQIETTEGVYDFTLINELLNLAKTYDIYLNLNWYGSFVDGETRTAYLPDYIYQDHETYPFIADLYDFGVLGRVGIIDWSNDQLMAREEAAVKALLGEVYHWSQANDNLTPVVQFQVGQGLDRFPRWRISQYEILDNGILMTTTKGWELVNGYIAAISGAAKTSLYQPLTRVEFTEQNAVVNYVYDIYDIDTVDMVSPTYLHQLPNVKSGLLSFQESFSDMPIYDAQNWADDNSYRLMLATIALGGDGFTAYPLSSPRYYPVSESGAVFGRYNPDSETPFVQKGTRADDLGEIMDGLLKASVDAATTPRRNFLVLGMDNRIPVGDTQKLYTTDGLFVDSQMASDGLGFVISNDGYVLVYVTSATTLTFSNVTFINASMGAYDASGSWVSDGAVSLINNNLTLEAAPYTLYRLKVFNLNALPTEFSSDYVGSYDAIRS